jgi:hypothetical protein
LSSYRERNQDEPDSLTTLRPYLPTEFRQLASTIDPDSAAPELRPLLRERFPFEYRRASRSIATTKTLEELGIEPVGLYWNGGDKARKESPRHGAP